LVAAGVLTVAVVLQPVATDEEKDGWQWFELRTEKLGPGTWRDEGDSGENFGELRVPGDTHRGPLGRVPSGGTVWYEGYIRLGIDRPIKVASRSKRGQEYLQQLLFIDSDGDGDLNDEESLNGKRLPIREIEPGLVWWPTFEWPRVQVSSETEGGQRRTVEVEITGYLLGSEWDLIILSPIIHEEFVARGKMEGEGFELRLRDWDGDGRLSPQYWSEDRVVVLPRPPGPPQENWQAQKLREAIVINSRLCKLAVEPARPAVGLKPYDEPTNTFKLKATDGRGHEMRVACLEVTLESAIKLTYLEPPATIEIPVEEHSWLARHGPWLEYQLKYPGDGEARWRFTGRVDLTLREGPAEVQLGGPLKMDSHCRVEQWREYNILTTWTSLVTPEGRKLIGTRGGARIHRRAWVIAPDGDVPATHDAVGQKGAWAYEPRIPQDAPSGKYSVNFVFDLGEYQEPVRGTAHFDL